MALGKKEQVFLVILVLLSISALLVLIGTVTTQWFGGSQNGEWNGYGTFCRNTGTFYTECLPESIDALCVVSVILLVSGIGAFILHLTKSILTVDTFRLIVVGMIFVTSILLLAIICSLIPNIGFSLRFVMTGCAFVQLLLLVSGIRLGQTMQSESGERVSNYTGRPLTYLTRGLVVFIALFTIIGMASEQWLGSRTTEGWSGVGTFCRQPPGSSSSDECVIRTVTTILSVVASVLSLIGLAIGVCAIFSLLTGRVERMALSLVSLLISVILWSTIVTVLDPSRTGYSLRLVMSAGPLVQLSLIFGGIWLSISRDDTESLQRWF